MAVLELDRKKVLREDAEHLIREHYRLAAELGWEATQAYMVGNHHTGDVLTEQRDLHSQTAATLEFLLEGI